MAVESDVPEEIFDIEPVLQRLRDLAEEYSGIEASQIPARLKDVDTWVQVIDRLQSMRAVHYKDEERQKDRTRIISERTAQIRMLRFEYDLVDQVVLKPNDLMLRKCSSIVDVAKAVWPLLKSLWRDLWGDQYLLKYGPLLWVIVTGWVSYILLSLSVKEMERVFEKALAIRDEACEEMRKAAFPQSTGKRVRRKKLTRG